MPRFSYKAKRGPDIVIEDVLEARDADHALELIIAQGLSPLDVFPCRDPKPRPAIIKPQWVHALGGRVSGIERVNLTRQFYDLVDAGVPLLRVLAVVGEEVANPRLKALVRSMQETVRDGGSLSDALSRHKDIFSPLYINMVRSGELSGNLNTVLRRLADFLEKDEETLSRVKTSLIYPGVILSVGTLTVVVLLTFVIPRLSEMFADMAADLPLVTVIVLGVSGFLARSWWVLTAALAVGIFYFQRFVNSCDGKYRFDRFLLRLPIIGDMVQTVEIGRLARTLATLLDSGVVILSALESTAAVLTNKVLRAQVLQMSKQVAAGASLRESLKSTSFFPPIAINMISVGEEAGNLQRSLHKLADSYERKAEGAMRALTSLLEPVLIVFIALIVGFVVIAMLLPIFQMNLIIQ